MSFDLRRLRSLGIEVHRSLLLHSKVRKDFNLFPFGSPNGVSLVARIINSSELGIWGEAGQPAISMGASKRFKLDPTRVPLDLCSSEHGFSETMIPNGHVVWSSFGVIIS
jgi:hypothetical protein